MYLSKSSQNEFVHIKTNACIPTPLFLFSEMIAYYVQLCNLFFSLNNRSWRSFMSIHNELSHFLFYCCLSNCMDIQYHDLFEKFPFHGYLYFLKSLAVTNNTAAKYPTPLPLYTCVSTAFG